MGLPLAAYFVLLGVVVEQLVADEEVVVLLALGEHGLQVAVVLLFEEPEVLVLAREVAGVGRLLEGRRVEYLEVLEVLLRVLHDRLVERNRQRRRVVVQLLVQRLAAFFVPLSFLNPLPILFRFLLL